MDDIPADFEELAKALDEPDTSAWSVDSAEGGWAMPSEGEWGARSDGETAQPSAAHRRRS